MATEHIHFGYPDADERAGHCEGYTDDAGCMSHPTKKDPRDGGVYCDMHAAAIDRFGADGTILRTTPNGVAPAR